MAEKDNVVQDQDAQEINAWLDGDDPFGGNIDLRKAPQHFAAVAAGESTTANVDPITGVPLDDEESEVKQVAEDPAQPPDAKEEPEVIEYDDGTKVIIEKDGGKFKATLDSGTGGGKEVFYGNSERELMTSVLAAKVHATKQIRNLHKQIKIETPAKKKAAAVPRTSQPEATSASGHQLSADEIFGLKTKFEVNPDAALREWFQKASGKSVEDVAAGAAAGMTASELVQWDIDSKRFVAAHPEYYPTQSNMADMLAYLDNHGLDYNFASLEEAFTALADGLEARPEPPPAVNHAPAPTEPTPVAERIAVQRRPRASFGLSRGDSTAVPTTPKPKELSDDALKELSPEQVAELVAIEARKVSAGLRNR